LKIDWYRFIPKYWFQNHKVNWKWDADLNNILDTAEEVVLGLHTTTIDGVQIWTGNWPYCYGNPYTPRGGAADFLPSVKTRIRLEKFVEDKQVERAKKNWTKA
jgi:hypothetical protein